MHHPQAIDDRFRHRLLKIAALAVAYYVGGKLGLSLAYLQPNASPVWPPTGIALAAVLFWGYKIWPGIWIGAFLVNLNTAGSFATSLAIAVGNTLEALIGGWLVNRYAGGRQAFEQTRSILSFIALGALLGTMFSSTIGVT